MHKFATVYAAAMNKQAGLWDDMKNSWNAYKYIGSGEYTKDVNDAVRAMRIARYSGTGLGAGAGSAAGFLLSKNNTPAVRLLASIVGGGLGGGAGYLGGKYLGDYIAKNMLTSRFRSHGLNV